MNQLWVALQFNDSSQQWEPSHHFCKVYQRASHIKSAIKTSKVKWTIIREDPNLIECQLVHYYRNPVTRRIETHPSPGTRLIFLDVSSSVAGQLPLPDQQEILKLPS